MSRGFGDNYRINNAWELTWSYINDKTVDLQPYVTFILIPFVIEVTENALNRRKALIPKVVRQEQAR